MNQAHDRYRRFLETLTPATLARLGDYVTNDVRFKDPFNDLRGVDSMQRVLLHMFDKLGSVTFRVRHFVADGDTCLMEWRFEAALNGQPWSFDGMSLISFSPDGLVKAHIDYWDAANAFYERLPVIGRLLAWMRLRLAVG